MKLSVMMITYNHERFIAQAIESVLAQRVNFDYEIVVGEDCSTDGTRAVIMDFYRRCPDRIVPNFRDRNLGPPRNLVETLASCHGEYVALLEGDDYWTCEDKLQKQVDFLDAHSDYTICCHRVQILDETGTWPGGVFPSIAAGTYMVNNLLEDNFIMTCATIYRRDSIGLLPKWFHEVFPSDWALFALIAKQGKIELMDEAMAMYRVHPGGMWSTRPETERLPMAIKLLQALDRHLEFQYTNTIRRTISRYRLRIAEHHWRMAHIARTVGNRLKTTKHVAGYLWNSGFELRGRRRALASFSGYAIFGSWYEAIRNRKAKRKSYIDSP